MPLATPDLRRQNLGLVLRQVAETSAASRSDIAETTGLSRGSVTSLVVELIDAGLVVESDVVAPAGMGRPRTMLRISDTAPCIVIGLLDADHATAVAASLAGDELARVTRRHGRPMGDPGAVLDVVALVIDEVTSAMADAGRRVADLCVVVWAPVGGTPPRVLADTDLGWSEVDILGLLRTRSSGIAAFESAGGELGLVTDVEVAAVAEHANVGSPAAMLYLKADSGIGGTVVFASGPGSSVRTIGAALGHLPVVPEGELCGCGQHGCLVTVAGPDVMLADAGLGPLAAEAGLTAAQNELLARLARHDATALRVWQGACAEIARTLQIVSLTVFPEVIVLGGFIAPLAADVDTAFRRIQPHIADAADLSSARIVGSTLGSDAALRGALHAARNRLLAKPIPL
ncbi:MAG: ROK family transcriptional regulator [Microbacterium sp.]